MLQQIHELLKEKNKEKVRAEVGPIKEKLAKIYDAAENYNRTKKYSHADKMKLWIVYIFVW